MLQFTYLPPSTDGGLALETVHIVAVWTEVFLYGLYTCLFVEATYFMLKKRREALEAAKVFLGAISMMYIVSSSHVALGLYRLLRAFVYHVEPAALYFVDFRRWETIAHNVLLCVMTWFGDMLMIYRCWVIWNHSYFVILLPLFILFLEFSVSTMLLVWSINPGMATLKIMLPWMATIYPLVFTQNVITTGMIAFKIWTQHRMSAASGAIDTSMRLSLYNILRILLESAAIYTFQILILLIVYPLHYKVQYIIQSAVIPSIGIVFVLISVRVHISGASAATPAGLAEWFGRPSPLDDTTRMIEFGFRTSRAGFRET